jgi:hypothetical protein
LADGLKLTFQPYFIADIQAESAAHQLHEGFPWPQEGWLVRQKSVSFIVQEVQTPESRRPFGKRDNADPLTLRLSV